MRYQSFRIQNFKGVQDATVSLEVIAGASVFALVGLNESGKTTVLEAIHSFSPDSATSELVGEGDSSAAYTKRIPRHLISTFTGDISVSATMNLTSDDKTEIARRLAEKTDLEIDVGQVPDLVSIERHQRFKSGDFEKSFLSLRTNVQVKNKGKRKWRAPTLDERGLVKDAIYSMTPDIAYFPTFVFEFPEKIFLTARGGNLDRFYRRVFQDILDYDGRGNTIQEDIVRRVRSDENTIPWASFFASWIGHDDRSKVQHVMDRASAAVSRLVFGRWNKIFNEDIKGKEVVISYEVVEGEVKNAHGAASRTNSHDVYIRFQIRDGTRRFNVDDRSLGFRWFFAFMLFTQCRVARTTSRPLLFLFDEPASNLHAAAQQKLIDSFPEIGRGDHTLAYTTHSHYMIEPKWLEQTSIVTNRADAPATQSVLDAASLDDESLDIKVTSYRAFVNEHPNQISYFQPILDRLEVIPSRFDLTRASIIVEGRSDYYILRYAARLLGKQEIPLLPGLGAGTVGALAALHVGWNLNFVFLLDGDCEGQSEKHRYVNEYGIPPERVATLNQFSPTISVIEDTLDDEARTHIRVKLGIQNGPSKGQIKRFFQERLASDAIDSLGEGFEGRVALLLASISDLLIQNTPA